MITIFKHPLEEYATAITLPDGALVRHVGFQESYPCIWVEVDTDIVSTKDYTFFVVGTGWKIPQEAVTYHGTALANNGLVWHVYSDGMLL